MALSQWQLGILYVNRLDLLKRAVDSMAPIHDHCIIIDNSDQELQETLAATEWPIPVWRAPVPLTFAQTQNWLATYAYKQGYPWYGAMHTDAEAKPPTCERLVFLAQQATDEHQQWGVIFTNYDALALYNTAALHAIGGWDTLFPQYYGDVDCYRRLQLAGYTLVDSGLPVLHEASSTIRSDKKREYLNRQTFDLFGTLYARKWGGPPHQEPWTVPYNGALEA